jgi:hypothetical protein
MALNEANSAPEKRKTARTWRRATKEIGMINPP